MIEVNISNLKKMYGATSIFEGISFTVKSGERVGLVGPNGCGKTTLLKMIMGQETITEGRISFLKGTTLGYLDQIPNFARDVLVLDILKDALKDLYDQKTYLKELTHELTIKKGHDLEKAMLTYSKVEADFAFKGGYEIDTKIAKVASGLKITEDLQTMPFDLLSGGEKTRVMLGHILLKNPSVLLLDEPSNHLDLESIEWLESYLQSYDGSLLLVSHDRYFLDNVCNKMVELSLHKAYIYHGNYSYFVLERERRFYLELKVYMAQQKKIKRMEEQIKQYRIWGVARDSEKMFKRAKELEKRLEKIERLDKPIKDPKKMKMKNQTSRTGKRVLNVQHLSKRFGDLVLLEDTGFELFYQDKLAILGDNGSGKTTLLSLILKDFDLEEPKYKWGSKIKIGYLPQEVHFEEPSYSLLDYFHHTHQIGHIEARRELAKALFTGDDVFKKIHQLSGGEKSRLKLASLTYEQVNVMVLDEPTNHLDISAREVLEDMLLAYEGTVLFVSHDRYFIKKIASRIAEIRDCKLHLYEGDYNYYRSIKQQETKEREDYVSTKNKQRNKQDKTNVKEVNINEEDLLKHLEEIEEKLHKNEENMQAVGHDVDQLQELYLKKQGLEEEYEQVFAMLESSEEDG
jgi:ATPase subunit of ABC transporter with duplicated ATPase domains